MGKTMYTRDKLEDLWMLGNFNRVSIKLHEEEIV